MNNIILFEVGKKYKGSFGTYTIIKRTKCFVTLQSGAKYKVTTEYGGREAFFFKRNVNYWGASFKELEGVFADNEVEG